MANPKMFKNWFLLSRVPFLTVGIAPMLVGTFWVKHYGQDINWFLAIMAIFAVIFTMLATYFAGEYHDRKEDSLSAKYGKSQFAGGSGITSRNVVKNSNILIAANASAILTVILGLFIFFFFHTGIWTLPLGAFGLFAGYFYSSPPLRLVKRKGLGELLIGICYAILPIYISSYIQTGNLDSKLLLISVPIALTITLVILINEFPDNKADIEVGKTNFAATFGLNVSSYVYIGLQLLNILSLYIISTSGIFMNSIWFLLPIILSIVLSFIVGFKLYRNKKILEAICALTIILNLSTSLIMILIL
jgi:1,4-dihydroxy-2-naphthoate octaprenyltransferase